MDCQWNPGEEKEAVLKKRGTWTQATGSAIPQANFCRRDAAQPFWFLQTTSQRVEMRTGRTGGLSIAIKEKMTASITKNQKPKTKNQSPITKNQEPISNHHKPRTNIKNQSPNTKHQRPKTKDQGNGISYPASLNTFNTQRKTAGGTPLNH